MSNKKLNSKKQKRRIIEEAAERLADIFIMQIEWNRKDKGKKVYGKEKV